MALNLNKVTYKNNGDSTLVSTGLVENNNFRFTHHSTMASKHIRDSHNQARPTRRCKCACVMAEGALMASMEMDND